MRFLSLETTLLIGDTGARVGHQRVKGPCRQVSLEVANGGREKRNSAPPRREKKGSKVESVPGLRGPHVTVQNKT